MYILRKSFILTFIIIISTWGEETSEILMIRNQYKVWQQIREKEKTTKQTIYQVFSGKNFTDSLWTCEPIFNDSFVGKKVVLTQSIDQGSMFVMTEDSPSGDWSIKSEHYYWNTGELFFIFWSMNTSYADEPLTIERRLYFNKDGSKIKFIESAYKINTKIKVDKPNYLNVEVKFWLNIKMVPFYDLIKME